MNRQSDFSKDFSLQKTPESKCIKADVILGSPSSMNCLGTGICRLIPTRTYKAMICKRTPALVKIKDSHVLQIIFDKSELNEEILKMHFSGAYFMIESKFVLPNWMRKNLNCGDKNTIMPGKYRINKMKHCVILEFVLT